MSAQLTKRMLGSTISLSSTLSASLGPVMSCRKGPSRPVQYPYIGPSLPGWRRTRPPAPPVTRGRLWRWSRVRRCGPSVRAAAADRFLQPDWCRRCAAADADAPASHRTAHNAGERSCPSPPWSSPGPVSARAPRGTSTWRRPHPS